MVKASVLAAADEEMRLYAGNRRAGMDGSRRCRGLQAQTVDGGAHWQPVMQAPMGPSLGVHVGNGAGPGPISVVDGNDAFVVGTCGPCEEGISPFPSSIEATHDGGLTADGD